VREELAMVGLLQLGDCAGGIGHGRTAAVRGFVRLELAMLVFCSYVCCLFAYKYAGRRLLYCGGYHMS
jgi:hypothetical protein